MPDEPDVDAGAAERLLRSWAAAYPETREDHPWGESAFKVRDKVFLFIGAPPDSALGFSVKLPRSFEFALEYPFVRPARYGLARARWVQVRLTENDRVPPLLLRGWLDESFRAVAPKRLAAALPPLAPE